MSTNVKDRPVICPELESLMESINTHWLTLVPMPDSNVTHCMSLNLFSPPLSTDGTYQNSLSHNECCCMTLNKIWHTIDSNNSNGSQ